MVQALNLFLGKLKKQKKKKIMMRLNVLKLINPQTFTKL